MTGEVERQLKQALAFQPYEKVKGDGKKQSKKNEKRKQKKKQQKQSDDDTFLSQIVSMNQKLVKEYSSELTRRVDEIGELFTKRLAQMTTCRDNWSLPESERKEVEVDAANYCVWLYTPHPILKWKDAKED